MKEEINMVKIMLVCSAGMSTSLLVNKMITEAEKRGLEAKIWATSEGESANEFAKDPADVILVGPQVRYLMNLLHHPKTYVYPQNENIRDYQHQHIRVLNRNYKL